MNSLQISFTRVARAQAANTVRVVAARNMSDLKDRKRAMEVSAHLDQRRIPCSTFYSKHTSTRRTSV